MSKWTIRIISLTAVGLGLGVLTGCPAPSVPTAVAPKKATAPTPTLPRVEVPPGVPAIRPPGTESVVHDNGIRAKVLVTRPGVGTLDRVPGGEKTSAVARYFRPYFLFDTYPHGGSPQFYQIGSRPQKDSVIGWVPATAVTRWDTRVGARYRREEGRRLPPLLVYADKAPLEEIISTGSTKAQPIARATWKADRVPMPWPITDVAHMTVDGQVHEVVQISFLGEFKEGSSLDADPPAAPETVGKLGGQEVKQIQAGIRQLDVVFVIDATGSMGPFIDAVKQTVKDLTARLKGLPFQPDVAFALVAYRDHDVPSGYITKHFDLEGDTDKFLGRIAELRAGEGGDTAEAVYDGVREALEKTSWRSRYSAKVLVLCGDASGHEPGEAQNPHGISRDRLVELAMRRQATIFGLPVGERKGNTDRERMWTQFEDLARRTKGDCFGISEAPALVERVRGILEATATTQGVRADVVEDLGKGKTPAQIAGERDLDIRKVTEVLEFLKSAGVDVAKLGVGNPTFAIGWALMEVRGTPILEREVYLARSEVSLLLGVLNVLCERLASPEGVLNLHRFAGDSRADGVLGFFEGREPAPLDVWLMARHIPVGRSSILRLTESEIRHMPEEKRHALRERLERQIIPALTNARSDGSLWTFRDDTEFGWIPERLLP